MGNALTIITIVVSALALVTSIITFIWNVKYDRKKATLDAINTLQEEAFDKLNKIPPSEIKDIVDHPMKRWNEYNEISGYVARIEHFCVGVNTRVYNNNIVYKLAHGYLDGDKLRSRIDPIIDKKNRNDDKDFYENIHIVLKKLEKIDN